jgi:hypothetical protein
MVPVTLTVAASSGATTLTLAPGVLIFGAQAMGVSSSAQQLQLNNIGAAALSISAVALTGSNAHDFC